LSRKAKRRSAKRTATCLKAVHERPHFVSELPWSFLFFRWSVARTAVLVLIHIDAAVVKVYQLLRERLLEQGQQIGPVRDIAVRAVEPLALFTHRLNEQHATVLPTAELPGRLNPNGEGWELVR
jgi:hypothetical protein